MSTTTRLAKLSVVAVAMGLTGLGSLTMAGEMGSEPTARDARMTRIDVSDLDLSRSADVEMLHRRITSAAISMCRADAAIWDVKRLSHRQQCVQAAVKRALAGVDAQLTALHRGWAHESKSYWPAPFGE
jgi:UrcA family protein